MIFLTPLEITLSIFALCFAPMLMTWWERQKRHRRAIAYYRHSAEGRQEYSISIQQEKVHAFAERNNIEIVFEYEDAGKSGLTADRPGFQALLAHVRRSNKGKNKDLDYVMCLDVSRWGRFQKTDESGYYETICAENGVKVIFSDHGDLKDEEDDEGDAFAESLWSDIGKPMERVLAKRHSQVLSEKVFAGAVKTSQQGNRAGGSPPFGTLRIEVDPHKKNEKVGLMKPKQHKSYPNNRVRLAPDEEGTAKIVQEIFELFVIKDYSESQIAALLNERLVPAPKGGKWLSTTISHILRDEQYIGAVIYNKTSAKLKSKRTRNPRSKWIITPDSYQPVVTAEIFAAAQAKFNLRSKRMSREEMQKHLRSAFARYNMLSHSLLQSLPDMPSLSEIVNEFGSLPEAIQSLYPELLEKVRHTVLKMIKSKTSEVLEYEDFLVINKAFSVKIAPAIPFPRGYGHRWYFRPDKRSSVDITLGVPLRDIQGVRILGYFPFVRILEYEALICIADSSSFKIGLYGYPDLSFILDLVHWTNQTGKEVKQ